MDSIDLGELDKIEKDIIIKNADWYYHGFDFALMSDILEEGILSKRHLNFSCPNFGLNGKYYVSVAKDITGKDCALPYYQKSGPLVILDNLKVIKCHKSNFYRLFKYTPLPFRYTAWSDEYQVYDKISPDKIIGFECMVYDWAKNGNLFLLKRFRTMLEIMQQLKCELPIYDYSREDEDVVHELDKEAFLEISK